MEDELQEREADEVARADANVQKVLRTLAVQQGPGEIMLAMKLCFRSGLSGDELVKAINARPSLLGGAEDLEELQANLQTTAFSDEERASWAEVRSPNISQDASAATGGTR